jgi:hypothetical protein
LLNSQPISMPITKPAKTIKYLSISLFIISLACPCFDTNKEIGYIGQGGSLLLAGILWFMFASPGVVWLSNPLLLISWLSVGKKPNRSFITSIIAILLAMCFLFYKDIIIDESGSNTTPIIAHKIGYWLWLASMLTMLIGNLYLQLSSTNNQTNLRSN